MNTKPRSKGPGRLLLALAIALVVVIGAAWAALAIFFPPARVRALVQAQLSSALAREVRFDDATIGLWPPVRITVRGLRLAEPGGLANGAAFEAGTLHLDLDVAALLVRRVVVRRLALERPALHLVLRADGGTNLDGLAAAPPPGAAGKPAAAPMDLSVRALVIDGARVLIDDLKSRRRIAAHVSATLDFDLERGGTRIATGGETRISALAFGPLSAARLSELDQSLAKIEWRIQHRGKYDAATRRLALERLALGFGRTDVAFSGVMNDPGPNAALDFTARGRNLDLGEILAALSAADAKALSGVRGGGMLDFDLAVRGRLGSPRPPTLTGVVRVTKGALRYPGAPAGVDAIAFTARLAPDSLGIGDLTARVSGQPVRAQLVVTGFADPYVRFTVDGDLDLAAVGPLVAPKDTKLGGRAAVDVRGQGRARDPGTIALDGRARLTDVSVESPSLPKKVEKIGGSLAFSQERATVSALTAQAGASSFTLDATVARPLALMAKPDSVPPSDVNFTLRSPHLDLAELLPAGPGAPLLPNARGAGRVEIARLINQKLDVTNVVANLALSPGVLEVPSFGLDGYGGAVKGTARFDLRDAARPIYVVKSTVDSVEADRLLSAWTPAKGLLHGALNTTLDFSGQGLTPEDIKRSLTAVGLAALANGTLGPGPSLDAIAAFTKIPAFKSVTFHDMKLPFRVEHGRVVTDAVTLKGNNGEWKLSGAIGLDGALDYAVSTTLPPEAVARLGAKGALAAGALADDQGRMLLDFRVTGPARSPRVAWDPDAMRSRLAGRASELLDAQRARLADQAREALLNSQKPAAGDSARVATPTLRQAAGDILKGFFGGAKDTTAH